jgi:magnesium transporter
VIAEGFPAADISELLQAHQDSTVWLDLFDPDEEDLHIVTEEFGLHPLAVEDAIQDHQRAKVDRYRTHLFLNAYAVQVDWDAPAPSVHKAEISAFITPRALVTVQKAAFDIDSVVARWDSDTDKPTAHQVGALVHGLLDVIVDEHYDVVLRMDEAIDALDDALFDPRGDIDIRRRGYALRRSQSELRRAVAPMGEVLAQIMRSDSHLMEPDLAPYYRDVADQVMRAADTLDNGRERVGGILDANLNEQGNRLNEITKKLAAWAAIIAVPTAVTGYYGQNVPYPGFGQHSGWIVSTTVIVVLAGGLYLLLRNRDWL